MKKYILFIIAGFFLLSCEKFLEEEYLSGENAETIVSTEANIEYLINADYAPLRIWYGVENGWDLTEAGTDLYTRGLDNRSAGFCTYSGFVGEEQDRMAAVWYEFYKALNGCNLALENIDNVEFEDPVVRQNRKGELYFLRAHYLWLITEIWGEAQLSTESVKDAAYEAYKSSKTDFYTQIFSDLDSALTLTPVTTPDYGRITQPTVKAFLARVHLMWASYNKYGLNISGHDYVQVNQAVADANYAEALDYVNQVISDYDYQLLPWKDIFAFDNIKNNEIIWAVNYSDNPQYTTANLMNPWDDDYWDENDNNPDDFRYNTDHIIQREGGNMGHLMWEIRYENLSWGLVRDIQNGRGFQRWMPTKFFIDLYNENEDARFHGSFKNVWYCNDEASAKKWKPSIIVDGVKIDIPQERWGQPMFGLGDTAIYFSKTPVPASEKAKFSESDQFYFHPEKGYIIIDINDMYLEDGSPNDDIINRQFYFPITKRYKDTTRLTIPQQYSRRDAFVMRISEMYLIAAEASLESGATQDAYDYLETLLAARAYDEDGAGLLATYGVNSAADIDIDFILDERARELATEEQRFFDLNRTGKLVERVSAHNTDAAPNIEDYHRLRFIPQEQLDAVRNPQEFKQNPGY